MKSTMIKDELEAREEEVAIAVDGVVLDGDLAVPTNATGIVIFAHGSGSSRMSPRNREVAETIREKGMGTLLFDLLTSDEERLDESTGALRFDIHMLATRLEGVTNWLITQPEWKQMKIGFFGASTGAAAALVAAARLGDRVAAVVSRGGRPDLASGVLEQVRCPTLLIVGSLDELVLRLNEDARAEMVCETELRIVPGATHLFSEPGKLEQVANLSARWFEKHMSRGAKERGGA
ncbi:MAG: dienelactone hydrolase family protein [Luteolibacter sp.]